MSDAPFLVFEGLDASGKSTQARRVAEAHGALFTFEPGGSAFGSELRRWILDAAVPLSPESEALLLLADRSHHVRHVIEPTLAEGRAVVCDRFFGSTLAYQGYGRGVDLELLERATELAIGPCVASETVLLDFSVASMLTRRAPDLADRFESSDVAFFERVRAGYLELAERYHWVVLDAAPDESEVARAVDAAVADLAW